MAFLRCPKCALNCGTRYVPYDVLRLLKMGFRTLEYSRSKSLLKKYLTEEMFKYLKFRRTINDVTLYDCIRYGLEIHTARIGIQACDPDSYFVFSPIFFPIIEEIHGFSPTDVHPKAMWQPIDDVETLESEKTFIKSIQIKVSRNLIDYPFCSKMTQEQFEKIEEGLVMILTLMTGEFDGTYERLIDMTEDRKKLLLQKSVLFDNNDYDLEIAGYYRHWPHGRGVFTNHDESLIVWINHIDHLEVISIEEGANLRNVYERMMKVMKKLSRDLNFIMSGRMGYLTVCPTKLGTGLKASMYLFLPILAEVEGFIFFLADEYNITVERVPDNEALYHICNRQCMGLTEFQCIKILEQAALNYISLEVSEIEWLSILGKSKLEFIH